MADNILVTQGSGTSIAADDIGGVLHQRVKISQGADGVAADVSADAPLQVSLANTGANATAVKVDNSAVTQPISGTVTANLSATDNAVLDTIAASTAAIETAVEGTLTVTGGGGGTEYTEGGTDATITGSAIMWEDTGDTLRAVSATKPLPVSATIDTTGLATTTTDTNTGTIAGDTTSIDGKLPALGQALAAASVPVILPAATITTLTPPAAISGFATSVKQDTIIGHVDGIETLLGTIDADTSTMAGAVSAGHVQVDVLTAPSTAVTNVGTFATQATLAAETTKVIGTVNIAAAQTIGITANSSVNVAQMNGVAVSMGAGAVGTGVQRVTHASDDPVTTAVQLIDNAISGAGFNITQLGGAAVPIGAGLEATAVRVTLPTNGTGIVGLATGSNAIGKLAANSGVDIGDVTLTAGTAEVGSLLPPDTDVTAHTNYIRKYYTNAGAATDGIIWSPAAGKRWHVTTLYINVSAAATVTLEDDKAGGDDPVWKGELAANSGVVIPFTEQYPMASGEDAADLLVTSSAGNIYITCVGYEI